MSGILKKHGASVAGDGSSCLVPARLTGGAWWGQEIGARRINYMSPKMARVGESRIRLTWAATRKRYMGPVS